MSTQTNIEWTDVTDNIIVVKGGGWWCEKISPACAHCYAEAVNQNKFFGGNGLKYSGTAPELILRGDLMDGWKRQKQPKRHFVASMTDVFGHWVFPSWHRWMLQSMEAAPKQTFQLLTKRADIMANRLFDFANLRGRALPKNIWPGFTAENQECFNERWREILQMVELLDQTPTIFVSCEPLLGPIVLPESFLKLGGLAQVIAGGESGKDARPSNPNWYRSLRDQCLKAGVKFFFKQWGEWAPWDFDDWKTEDLKSHVFDRDAEDVEDVQIVYRIGKKTAGRMLDGREWSEFPNTAWDFAGEEVATD